MSAPSCPGRRERDERLAALEARVRELEARLGKGASDSSLPPSANPPQAPPPVVKTPTGKKRGGQPGQPPLLRRRLPPQRLQQVIPYVPKTCGRCQAPLPAEAGPGDPAPTWHPVADLPEAAAHVVEYQGHARTCPCCGEVTHAAVPAAVFHLDGAPAESLLVVGYEPSKVHSRMYLADYARAAFDLGIEPQQFLADLNPMYRRGEEALSGYVTELPPAAEGRSRILLVNNSSLPFTEGRTNPLGVMHKAEIVNPTEAERRIVNSMMLVVAETDEIGWDRQQEFVATEKISQKVY